MEISVQRQIIPIEENIRARYSLIIPIIRGMLYSTKLDIVNNCGGIDGITFDTFTRIYIEHPGDYGICFEYAVHEAIRNKDPVLQPYISSIINDYCKIKDEAQSILFAIEKTGNAYIVESNKGLINKDSRILVGSAGKPPLLERHLENIKKAFHNPKYVEKLPDCIKGIWKADLFLGGQTTNQWVATTLKTRKEAFEAAPGLRIGMYPEADKKKKVVIDSAKNLIMCPLPYNGDFMQLFGASFAIVKQIIAAHCNQPSRVALYYEDDQAVAKYLVDRKEFTVKAILESLEAIKQVGLLHEEKETISANDPESGLIAPISLLI